MPVPPNALVANAIDIGTARPVTIVQTGITDGITTYAVWYKFTAQADDKVLGIYGSGVIGAYEPRITVYTDAVSTLYLAGFQGVNVPVQVPVVPGSTYWLKFVSSTGFQAVATLTINVQRAPINTVSIGSIFIPDDRDGFPAAFLNKATGEVLRFEYPFPGGEGGDILPDGTMLVQDTGAANLKLYDGELTLLQTIAFLYTSGDPSIRTNKVDKFYVGGSGTVNGLVKRFSATGVLEDTWSLTAAVVVGIAPSNDETILYVTGQGGTTSPIIKRWDLVNDVFLSDLTTGVANHVAPEDILVLDDDSIIVAFDKFTATKNTTLVQYNAAGAVLNSTDYGSDVAGVKTRLAYDLDDPDVFWMWRHTGTFGDSLFSRVRASDFVELSSFLRVTFEQGIFQGPAEADPIRFGHSESCPFFFARVAIGPPPSPSPSVSTPKLVMRRLRRSPHINEERIRLFCKRFELDLQRGLGMAPGSLIDGLTDYESPTVMMRVSTDGGITWSSEFHMGAGAVGNYKARPYYVMLGSGDDFVFEVTVSDPVIGWYLANAYADFEKGLS